MVYKIKNKGTIKERQGFLVDMRQVSWITT